jgi:DNA-binding transcriptional MerR regulator
MRSRVDNTVVDQKRYLRSAELATLAGVSPDTLRHYERMRLLATPPRSGGNYRLYPPEAVDRVRLIRHALAVGFSLSELAKILKVRDAGGAPCRQVKGLLEKKLLTMEEQIADLVAMRKHLRALLADWEERLAHISKGKRASLLETLVVPAYRPKLHKLEGHAIQQAQKESI